MAFVIVSGMAVPAVAAPTHTSATFPQDGKMLEDYSYTNAATITNLKVASGSVDAVAGYTDCPSGYPNSDAGATSTDECYKACTVADLPANSHAATATGKNYSGANMTDTCAIATCNSGYTLNPAINLNEVIGESTGVANVSVDNSGEVHTDNNSSYGLSATDINTFIVDYGAGKGKIIGHGLCSTVEGDNQNFTWVNPTETNNLTPEFGTGQYCYCQLDVYVQDNGNRLNIGSPWIFRSDRGSISECASNCAYGCGYVLKNTEVRYLNFRAAMFSAAGVVRGATCDANVITIRWFDASTEDINANNAGTMTYGGDINTPRAAVHKPGKLFTGWTFSIPAND